MKSWPDRSALATAVCEFVLDVMRPTHPGVRCLGLALVTRLRGFAGLDGPFRGLHRARRRRIGGDGVNGR